MGRPQLRVQGLERPPAAPPVGLGRLLGLGRLFGLGLGLGSLACGKERPVEAPVIDVSVAPWDGSARALAVDPPPAPEPPADPSGIAGRWEGVGVQDDGQAWPMIVEISSSTAGVCAEADYPTIPCRAEWVCIAQQRDVIQATERLLDDSAHRCVDNGTMTLRVGSDGMLDWTWSGSGQTARARLHRAR